MSQQNLHQHLDAYLLHLRAGQYSVRTCEAYEERLRPFIHWCGLRSVQYPAQVSLAVLEAYQRYLGQYRRQNGRYLAINSQRNRLLTIRQWFRWLLQRHVILYSPAEMLTLPKEVRSRPSGVMSEQETTQVLRASDNGTPLGLRNRAILETFWSSGIRRMELSRLRLGDADLSRGVLRVNQGKGRKDRVVPLGERAVIWITRYLSDVRPRLAQRADSGHLFLTIKGGPMSRAVLTQLAGKAIRENARLKKAGACHLFRHSMATQMLDNGADIRHIQAILGHEKLDTTQVYTRVAIGQLQKVHRSAHPGNRKKADKK